MTFLALLPLSWLVCLWAPELAHSQQKSPPAAQKKAAAAYPSFEPFFGHGVQKVLFENPDELVFADVAKDVEKMAAIQKMAKKAAGDASGAKPPEGVSAALLPEVPAEQRALYAAVPLVMRRLEPLFEAKSWDAAQLGLAGSALEFLQRLPDPPKLAFAEGKHDANHKQLEKLAGWFREQVQKPERYAAMVYTWDEGPFAGLAFEAKEVLPSYATVRIDEHLELHLARVERPKEPCVLQCLRDGKPLWTRLVSASPDESVRKVEPGQEPLEKLGAYGFAIHLFASWSGGEEHMPVYLDAQGRLLFYFLSW